MVLDPGDFSGSHGWRLGWRMPLLLWKSTTGTLLLVAFVVSLGIVGTYASPPLMRVVRWGAIGNSNDGEQTDEPKRRSRRFLKSTFLAAAGLSAAFCEWPCSPIRTRLLHPSSTRRVSRSQSVHSMKYGASQKPHSSAAVLRWWANL